LIFEYDNIVIGSNLAALMYAYENQYPIFFTRAERPFRFDYLEPGIDLSCLKIPTCNKSLTTLGDESKIGVPKEILWERLLFLLSLDGKVPLSNLCHNIRYDGSRVVCSNEYSKIMEFNFQACYYFGDNNATGFVQQKSLDEDMYLCYDYIGFNKGGKHEVDFIHTNDDFVGKIWFYSSDRIDGNTPVRDACAVSELTTKQLLDFDYSETMARFKVVHEMEKRGMKGIFAHGYTKSGKPKHYKFRTTSIRRETHKRRVAEEPQSENVKIAEYCEDNLLQALSQTCVAYDRFLKYL
jgi:hypothetical protein